MKQFSTAAVTAALTVLLVALCSPAHSSSRHNGTHNAIADVFEARYAGTSGVGIIVKSDDIDDTVRTGITIIGVKASDGELCAAFNTPAGPVDYIVTRYNDGSFRYEACD